MSHPITWQEVSETLPEDIIDKRSEHLLDASSLDGTVGECIRCGSDDYIVKYGHCEECAADMGII